MSTALITSTYILFLDRNKTVDDFFKRQENLFYLWWINSYVAFMASKIIKILVLCFVHFVVCAKLEQGLGILIAFPMIFELLLLIAGIQGELKFSYG